ncbi:MAG: glycosyltransferase [Nitrospira sp.]|nr:glycosyltransferase [Nitrospira sp.]
MMHGQNIICFANDWDADPTSKHQVMKILARSNRVLWVNSIGLRRPGASAGDASRMLQKLKKFMQGPVSVMPNLHVVTPLVIPFHDIKGVPTFNAWFLARYIRYQATRLGMSDFQVWTFMPTMASVIAHLRPQKVIYYCVDEWSAFSFLNAKLMADMEAEVIRQSDLVITSAETLYESKRALHPKTYLVSHGVDSEHFGKATSSDTAVPREVATLPHPVIGFWGLIHEWIDLELIAEVAAKRPRWSFVLIGKSGVDCSVLEQVPNVHLLGVRSYDTLPAFAKGFTVGIMPFRINRLTDNVNPIKLREYLAAGLPVVSTPLREARAYQHVVRFGSTATEFTAALDEAVGIRQGLDSRVFLDAVADETWVSKVQYISELVDGLNSSTPSKSQGR